jgi:hypothetical protein
MISSALIPLPLREGLGEGCQRTDLCRLNRITTLGRAARPGSH